VEAYSGRIKLHGNPLLIDSATSESRASDLGRPEGNKKERKRAKIDDPEVAQKLLTALLRESSEVSYI